MSNANRPPTTTQFLVLQGLTLARIPLAGLFAAILLSAGTQRLWVLCVCTFLLLLIELSDLFDGFSARKLGMVTEWGAMLDPYSDSIARIIVYWSLACSQVQLALAFVPLAMAIRDVTVAYSRIIIARQGGSVSAKWSGKAKAIVQGVGAIIILLGPIYWPWIGKWPMPILSWIVAIVTLCSLIEYVRAAIHVAFKK